MKKALMTLAAAGVAMSVAIPALAQTVGVGVTIAPEERTRIKEYVVEEKIAPAKIEKRISVGAKVPTTVELHTVPSAWGASYSKYRYVYADDQVYLVEPSSREVVTVID